MSVEVLRVQRIPLFRALGLLPVARTLALLSGLLAAEPIALFPAFNPCMAFSCLLVVRLAIFDFRWKEGSGRTAPAGRRRLGGGPSAHPLDRPTPTASNELASARVTRRKQLSGDGK